MRDPGGPGRFFGGIGTGESMALILEFRSSVAKAEPEPVQAGGAEIIIFPGVRRERHEEPPAKQQRRRERSRTKRDRLELPD